MLYDSTPSSPVAPGDVVADKYRVERVLGVGGMGVVVAARHVTLDQVVAIKFLSGDGGGASREELVARFLAEARAAARIESDHVCRVFDVAQTPHGIPFMVMEYLEGSDLEEEIERRGQLGITEAVDYVLQAAEALAAAHALGIVHRDVKPANLFLTVRPDGSRRVKVLDFGISRAIAQGPSRADGEARSLGTPAYMSPEAARGASDVDGRADLWALGAILYEAITGQMAFVGDSLKSILAMVASEDPCPMSALRRGVPPELEQIVSRCLERDRERRWPTAAQLARALAAFGSVGIVTALTSVQRELGSLASIKTATTQSVEPMVASVRGAFVTEPDPEELRARGEIVQDWSKLRARRRMGRVVVALASAATLAVAGVAAFVLHARGRALDPPAAAAFAPPPVASSDEPPPAATEAATSSASASASPATSVYNASNAVRSTHAPASRAAPPHGAPPPARNAPKPSVNHLLDTRD